MITILAGLLAVLGAFFMFTAALGVAIFKDVYARMHCAGKSATLGPRPRFVIPAAAGHALR